MLNSSKKLIFVAFVLASTQLSFAAQAIDLSEKEASYIKSFVKAATFKEKSLSHNNLSNIEEVSRSLDFNQTLHVRIKQTYAGFPVWGGEGVLHVQEGQAFVKKSDFLTAMNGATLAKTTTTGTFYEGLEQDLARTPSYVFAANQALNALNRAIYDYQKKHGNAGQISHKENQIIVYMDDKDKARYAFLVSFYVETNGKIPANPSYIMDATNLNIYQTWDNVKSFAKAEGGGFGGNVKIGKLSYGTVGGLAKLDIERDAASNTCYLKNDKVSVADQRISEDKVVTFPCEKVDSEHNNVYWDGDRDQINGGYSPNNDALYAGAIIHEMYATWYQQAPIMVANKPLLLSMVTHSPLIINQVSYPDNAAWDPIKKRMYFGDGEVLFYPLTSLGIAAHEISHGVTGQASFSRLGAYGMAAGINESFSDMASKAAEFFVKGENDWELGSEIIKTNLFTSLRSMENPASDCELLHQLGEKDCSINNADQYRADLDSHNSSGVYNRAFYLLATSPGFDTKKAFDVMFEANKHYWTPRTTFKSGACGVLLATKNYHYDTKAVVKAFDAVGIPTKHCRK